MNLALLGLQFAFIAVFLFVAFAAASGIHLPSLASVFLNNQANLALILSGSALLCFSFLGFDAVSTLAEETKRPERTILVPSSSSLCSAVCCSCCCRPRPTP